MITGAHAVIYAEDGDATRTFLRDVLGWSNVDAGGGWLIFKLPPAEVGIHPTDGGEVPSGRHQLYLTCDDLDATIAELAAKGVELAEPIHEERWGRVTAIVVPGGGQLGLYEPKHPLASALDA